MATSNSNLTKTCSSCGLQKPLSAFLQLTGSEGASYGSICSTCRKTNAEKDAHKESEETRSGSGHKIDAAKFQYDTDTKKLTKEELDELHKQERDEAEQNVIQEARKNEVVREQKKQVESFLTRSSFLSDKRKAEPSKSEITEQQIEQAVLQEALNKEEVQQKTVNTAAPFLPSKHGFEHKYGESFKRLRTLLAGSPLGRTAAEPAKKTDQSKTVTEKNLIDDAENKWSGPGNRRR